MGKDLKGKEIGKGLMQRKDGTYTFRYSLHGKRIEERFSKLSDARKRKTDIEYWQEHGINSKTSLITLNTWFEYSMQNIHSANKQRTIDNYEYLYNSFVKNEIGFLYLNDIVSAQCNDIINRMQDDGYATSVIDGVRKMLSMLFNEAIEDERIYKNPINRNVKRLKVKRLKERLALTEEERKEFEIAARASSHYNMMILALETGLRAGELGGLFIEDYNPIDGTLCINRTLRERKYRDTKPFYEPKTSSSKRCIILNKRAREIVELQIGVSHSIHSNNDSFKTLLFKARTGNPVYGNDLRKAMKYAEGRINKVRKEQAEINGTCFIPFPEIFPHALRHTFTTRCIINGVNPKVTQQYLGHSNINITLDTYTHFGREQDFVRNEIEKLDNTFEPYDSSNVIKLADYQKIG